jgi:hypothetical protein
MSRLAACVTNKLGAAFLIACQNIMEFHDDLRLSRVRVIRANILNFLLPLRYIHLPKCIILLLKLLADQDHVAANYFAANYTNVK